MGNCICGQALALYLLETGDERLFFLYLGTAIFDKYRNCGLFVKWCHLVYLSNDFDYAVVVAIDQKIQGKFFLYHSTLNDFVSLRIQLSKFSLSEKTNEMARVVFTFHDKGNYGNLHGMSFLSDGGIYEKNIVYQRGKDIAFCYIMVGVWWSYLV